MSKQKPEYALSSNTCRRCIWRYEDEAILCDHPAAIVTAQFSNLRFPVNHLIKPAPKQPFIEEINGCYYCHAFVLDPKE